MTPLVAYFSRTGTTATVASAVADRFDDPTVERVRPVAERGYLRWLACSFVPGSTVAIEPGVSDFEPYDAVLLGTPKWTLSCPPVNAFIERAAFDGTTVGLFLTCGGFDEDRYCRRLTERLEGVGADVVATLVVRRDRVEAGAFEAAVDSFCESVRAAVRPAPTG